MYGRMLAHKIQIYSFLHLSNWTADWRVAKTQSLHHLAHIKQNQFGLTVFKSRAEWSLKQCAEEKQPIFYVPSYNSLHAMGGKSNSSHLIFICKQAFLPKTMKKNIKPDLRLILKASTYMLLHRHGMQGYLNIQKHLQLCTNCCCHWV